MRIFPLACAAVMSGGALFAEFHVKPDANTLWLEDGKAISGWRDDQIAFTPADPGPGFTVTSTDYKKYAGGRRTPVNADYPWVVYEITAVLPNAKYVSRAMGYNGCFHGQVSNLQPGIFVWNIYAENPKLPASGGAFLSLYAHGHTAEFKYLKAVKLPDQYIVVSTPDPAAVNPGDTVKFSVHLARPAEDVSLQFYDSYTMPRLLLNGQDKLQLKPEDEAGKIWSAEVKVTGLGNKPEYKYNAIWVKAVILGGDVSVPVWTPIRPVWHNTEVKK